ncbi:MAG: DUF1684 domain-containing protein [Cytophagales bacterium]|nr:DUF1684 domain-containing protein [Cytophagales bacterium]
MMLISCSQVKTLTPEEVEAHRAEVETWHAEREANLKAPNGWLNLVGLYWLEPGPNTFGSATTNALVFPDKITEQAGYFLVKENVVTLVVNKGVEATVNNQLISSHVIFHPDSARPTQVQMGDLRFNIIKRDTKLGVRVRDAHADALHAFTGVARYPVNTAYRIEAVLERGDSARTVAITNVLGQTTAQRSPGTVQFTWNGKSYRLDALEEGEELFIIFADSTSGNETYGAGRFLYAKKPSADNKVILDFNKAYNPPCAFTAFATCPLPPRQNVLPIAIRAGEKNYGEGPVHVLPVQ